jgi:hypothetical protein
VPPQRWPRPQDNQRGVHQRELNGLAYLSSSLPEERHGFYNLDLVLDLGRPREIDLILIADLGIFLADLKDWREEIESRDGRWFLHGKDIDYCRELPCLRSTGINQAVANCAL